MSLSSLFGPVLVSVALLDDLAVLLVLVSAGWLLSAGVLQLAKPNASKALAAKMNPFFI